jgi:hypothetical protein
MPEMTFRSPNFYEREIDLSAPTPVVANGVPAAVVGTANKGPAFVPVTVANFDEFVETFGDLDVTKHGPYAANEWLKHRQALSYLRVLGAGANTTEAHILSTQTSGRVNNAGFKLEGTLATHDSRGRHTGVVQFLTARHELNANQDIGMPMFTDNRSFNGSFVHCVRGVLMTPSGSRIMVLNGNESAVGAFTAAGPDDYATVVGDKFKLVISSTLGNSYYNSDENPGVKILTASLDPSSVDYFGKILNRDPDRFVQDQHFLYADFPVDAEIAAATVVGVVSGSANASETSGEPSTLFRQAFGAYDTRYKTPSTTWFISQPFGVTEYDLFRIESRDDGEYANKLWKISITNIKASANEADRYGTFTVELRSWNDNDVNSNVVESFTECNLDPQSDNYVAKRIGDRKVYYNFDTTLDSDRNIVAEGKYNNNSKYVRVVMSDAVERKLIPDTSLPFGFRGTHVLKTNDSLTDDNVTGNDPRLSGVFGTSVESRLSGSILPPIPFRYKVTRGQVNTSPTWDGEPSPTEVANSSFTWGVKFERNNTPLNANTSTEKNALIDNLTKFMGIEKLDVLVTGSGADLLNNNKFTLAKVALSNTSITHLTASTNQHMREAVYIRNAVLDNSEYTINDSVLGNRITLATLLSKGTAAQFNTFSPFAKFTTFMYGGYDGTNFLDKNARQMNDKACSFDAGGNAEAEFISPGFLTNQNGTDVSNSTVNSYVTAINIMTDPMIANHNLLAIPGIRESYITDTAASKVKDYGLAMFVMDIPSYDDNAARIYDDSTTKPSVTQTATAFEGRVIDNSYAAPYYPDVFIDDEKNNRRVKVPASVASIGAIAFNDKLKYPWFAPAGFNRASLDFVKNVVVRLNVSDRDRLYDTSRINPIATFPKIGFVVYGQKTLQLKKSALDRINVRRMLLEVKRVIINIAKRLPFENNTPALRASFVSKANQELSLIQVQSGIEKFQVVMNETNNTQEDINLNKLNGRVVVIPTRSIEFISIDFIISNNGINFI